MSTAANWLSTVPNCQIETSMQSRKGERKDIDEVSIVGFEIDINTPPIRSPLLCESLLVLFQVTVILSHHSVSISLSRGCVMYLNLELAIHEVASESLITLPHTYNSTTSSRTVPPVTTYEPKNGAF